MLLALLNWKTFASATPFSSPSVESNKNESREDFYQNLRSGGAFFLTFVRKFRVQYSYESVWIHLAVKLRDFHSVVNSRLLMLSFGQNETTVIISIGVLST